MSRLHRWILWFDRRANELGTATVYRQVSESIKDLSMNKRVYWIVALIAVLGAENVFAASEWNTQDYDLYPGDFDGDGKMDMLYVAKSPDKGSGIALSDGTQLVAGNIVWNSTGFGLIWHSNIYRPIVGDFNGD